MDNCKVIAITNQKGGVAYGKLHLLSDSSSRRTPLVFSYTLPTTRRVRDFHPLDSAHAGHTYHSRVYKRMIHPAGMLRS
jgi:hypothetical protein